MAKEMVPRRRDSEIPFYAELCDYGRNYDWVDEYLPAEKARLRLAELRHDLRRMKKMRPDLETFKKLVKNSYESYRQSRVEALAGMFRNQYHRSAGNNPLLAIKGHISREGFLRVPFVEWEEIEAALGTLNELGDGVTDEERRAEIKRLSDEIAVQQAIIDEHSPPEVFGKDNAGLPVDMRVAFVGKWWNLQGYVDAPCGPRGLPLVASPGPEQVAYDALEIRKNCRPDAAKVPYQ